MASHGEVEQGDPRDPSVDPVSRSTHADEPDRYVNSGGVDTLGVSWRRSLLDESVIHVQSQRRWVHFLLFVALEVGPGWDVGVFGCALR